MPGFSLQRYGDGATRNGQPLTQGEKAAAHELGQLEVLHHGRRVGYCSADPRDPWISFVHVPAKFKLTVPEKLEAIDFCAGELGVAEMRLNRQLREMIETHGRQWQPKNGADENSDSGSK